MPDAHSAHARDPAVPDPAAGVPPAAPLPFRVDELDALLEDAGIEVLVANSKHNVQYLLGGHRYHFFAHMDAIGLSRYLPLLVYERGRPDRAAYIANSGEANAVETRRKEAGFWPGTVLPRASGTRGAMALAIEHLRRIGAGGKRLGIEAAFLPADAAFMLRDAFPTHPLADAQLPLERLRAVKTPGELALLRRASEAVVDAMLAVFAAHGPGTTKRALEAALHREEAARGLTFEYALIAAGASHVRTPSDEAWREGDVLSLDSGANLDGYIGDLCRMGMLGPPDAELMDLLGEVEEVQQAARRPIRAGAPGREIYDAAEPVVARSRHAGRVRFVAHGMGLISHEAPRLTATGPVPYPADDADRPLRAGMVLSVETTLLHPRRGFIKLEDTVAVTQTGCEGFGDGGRGWNRGGTG